MTTQFRLQRALLLADLLPYEKPSDPATPGWGGIEADQLGAELMKGGIASISTALANLLLRAVEREEQLHPIARAPVTTLHFGKFSQFGSEPDRKTGDGHIDLEPCPHLTRDQDGARMRCNEGPAPPTPASPPSELYGEDRDLAGLQAASEAYQLRDEADTGPCPHGSLDACMACDLKDVAQSFACPTKVAAEATPASPPSEEEAEQDEPFGVNELRGHIGRRVGDKRYAITLDGVQVSALLADAGRGLEERDALRARVEESESLMLAATSQRDEARARVEELRSRLVTIVDEACGLQPVDTSDEDLFTLLEKDHHDWRIRAYSAGSRVEQLEGERDELKRKLEAAQLEYDRGRRDGREDVGKYSNAIGRIESALGLVGAAALDTTVQSVVTAVARIQQLEGERDELKLQVASLEPETMTLTSERDTARMTQDELKRKLEEARDAHVFASGTAEAIRDAKLRKDIFDCVEQHPTKPKIATWHYHRALQLISEYRRELTALSALDQQPEPASGAVASTMTQGQWHKCPKCRGSGIVASAGEYLSAHCPECRGGMVWVDPPSGESAEPKG